MREKIAKIFNKIYGAIIIISFFAGILPLIPFIIAIILGGAAAEAICLFLYNQYYPWVIIGASVSVVVGLLGMYIEKYDFSVDKNSKKKGKEEQSNEEKELEQSAQN